MQKTLTLSVGILLCAGAAFGQAGGIGLYVDVVVFSQCDYDDTAPNSVDIYAVHKHTQGATASRWKVEAGGGFNCAYIGEITPTGSVGDTQNGIAIGYGACLSSTILLATIHYLCSGTNPPCAFLEVVPDPSAPSGKIEVVDCSFVTLEGVGSTLFVNNDGTCGRPCGIPTRETNWGRVKALYH
jgi:hypothetical protein